MTHIITSYDAHARSGCVTYAQWNALSPETGGSMALVLHRPRYLPSTAGPASECPFEAIFTEDEVPSAYGAKAARNSACPLDSRALMNPTMAPTTMARQFTWIMSAPWQR